MSEYYVGRRGSLGAAKEGLTTTRGTPVTPALYCPYNSISIDDKTVTVDSEAAFGQIADSYESYCVKKYGEGEIEFDLDDKFIGLILSAVMGASPTSTAGPTNYVHTYTVANTNQHQSLSLLVQDPNISRMFPLSMVDKFTLKVEPEGIAKCTVGFRSQRGKEWQLVAPVYTALGNKFIHSMLAFSITDNPLDIKSLEFSVSKNIEDFQDLGTATPSDILNKQFVVEGNFELGFQDNTYRNYMLDPATTKHIDIVLTYGANNSLAIALPRVRFANWEPNKGLNDIATQKIEFKGLYGVAASAQIITNIVLSNQLAGGTY